MPTIVSAALFTLTLALGACSSDGAPAVGPPCDVEGGACPAGSMCIHVCDCCGIPPDEDAGIVPSGHDTCVPSAGACEQGFLFEGRRCNCEGEVEASCPCA